MVYVVADGGIPEPCVAGTNPAGALVYDLVIERFVDDSIAVSELLIHKQITLYGSWVTSLRHMEDLLQHLVRWQLRPETIVTHRFRLDQADEAYQIADQGAAGKVCIVMD